jgi:phosphate transport system substrate-binding protein
MVSKSASTLFQSYDYPIARPLFFYAKKAHIGVIPGMQEYMEEVCE